VKNNIIILGGGQAGIYAAREIRRKRGRHISVSGNVIFVWNEHHTLDMEELE